jgi:hypothetical protein
MRRRGRSRIAAEFFFLDDPLMRLVGAFDAILTIIAFRRKQLCDLVDATCRGAAIDPRGVEHALADFELRSVARPIVFRNRMSQGMKIISGASTPPTVFCRAFARRFPAVAEALLSGASAQLRNAAAPPLDVYRTGETAWLELDPEQMTPIV